MRAIFQFSELDEPYTFRELDTGNLRPPQQFDVSFVRYGIGFVRIADFFYILYLSLKNCKLYGSTYLTYPPLPILQNLSSRTYPSEPILYYLSSNRFYIDGNYFLKCS